MVSLCFVSVNCCDGGFLEVFLLLCFTLATYTTKRSFDRVFMVTVQQFSF